MASAHHEHEVHVQARFFTKLKRFKTENTPFSLPAVAGCSQLNALLKGILFGDNLEESERIQFDFLINGEFLRLTLSEFIAEKNIHTESEIEIEYIIKENAPHLEQTLQHDDWISSVDLKHNLVLTGSYDNTVSIWDLKGKCITAVEGHVKAVKDVKWVSSDQSTATFLSASQDQTVIIWKYDLNKESSECVHICRGHAGSVDCLAVQPTASKFASGSWDKVIKIWDGDLTTSNINEDEETSESQKKRKTNSSSVITNRLPLMSLSGHKEPVSSLLWSEKSQIISAGLDHCIRLWDVETATNKHTLTGSKVILDISFSTHKQLLASGSTDKFVRLWDPRSMDGAVVKTVLSSHEGWVSAVAWSPTNENHLCTASYDETVKFWDIRNNNTALYDLEKHDDKVMCLCWEETDTILSGGADSRVHIYKHEPKSLDESEE